MFCLFDTGIFVIMQFVTFVFRQKFTFACNRLSRCDYVMLIFVLNMYCIGIVALFATSNQSLKFQQSFSSIICSFFISNQIFPLFIICFVSVALPFLRVKLSPKSSKFSVWKLTIRSRRRTFVDKIGEQTFILPPFQVETGNALA